MKAGLRGVTAKSMLIFGVVFLLAEVLVMLTRTTWIGLLGYTPEWANAGLYVASPIVAAAAAFVSRDFFSAEVVALTGGRNIRRASRVVASAWLRIFAVAYTSHLVVMIIAISVTLAFGSSGELRWEPFVYAVMPLSIACAIGVLVSAAFPHLWAAPFALIFTYGVWYISVTTGSALPINIGGATVSLTGLVYDGRALAIGLFLAAAASVVLLSVASLIVVWGSFSRSLSAIFATSFCIIIGGTILGAHLSTDRFIAGSDTQFECAGTAPQVCLAAEHSTRLDTIASGVEKGALHLTEAGIDIEGLVLREEVVGAAYPEDGTLLLPFGRVNGIGVSDLDYALALLRPSNCAAYREADLSEELERLFRAADVVSIWINDRVSGRESAVEDAQVVTLYEGLTDCSVDEQDLPSVELP